MHFCYKKYICRQIKFIYLAHSASVCERKWRIHPTRYGDKQSNEWVAVWPGNVAKLLQKLQKNDFTGRVIVGDLGKIILPYGLKSCPKYNKSSNLVTLLGGSPGLGGDSYSEGHEFKSRHCILDGHFFTYICWKNCNNVCLKRPKINYKWGRGWPIF